jgi:cytoskeletal protein CcmA (bactofilin family)
MGDVEAPVVVLEEGVLFQGHCRMTKPQIAADGTQRDLSAVTVKRSISSTSATSVVS